MDRKRDPQSQYHIRAQPISRKAIQPTVPRVSLTARFPNPRSSYGDIECKCNRVVQVVCFNRRGDDGNHTGGEDANYHKLLTDRKLELPDDGDRQDDGYEILDCVAHRSCQKELRYIDAGEFVIDRPGRLDKRKPRAACIDVIHTTSVDQNPRMRIMVCQNQHLSQCFRPWDRPYRHMRHSATVNATYHTVNKIAKKMRV